VHNDVLSNDHNDTYHTDEELVSESSGPVTESSGELISADTAPLRRIWNLAEYTATELRQYTVSWHTTEQTFMNISKNKYAQLLKNCLEHDHVSFFKLQENRRRLECASVFENELKMLFPLVLAWDRLREYCGNRRKYAREVASTLEYSRFLQLDDNCVQTHAQQIRFLRSFVRPTGSEAFREVAVAAPANYVKWCFQIMDCYLTCHAYLQGEKEHCMRLNDGNRHKHINYILMKYLERKIAVMNGMDGVDGVHGVDGMDGVDGVHGVDGVDGVDGVHGVDGVDDMEAVAYFNETFVIFPALLKDNKTMALIIDILMLDLNSILSQLIITQNYNTFCVRQQDLWLRDADGLEQNCLTDKVILWDARRRAWRIYPIESICKKALFFEKLLQKDCTGCCICLEPLENCRHLTACRTCCGSFCTEHIDQMHTILCPLCRSSLRSDVSQVTVTWSEAAA
jgi:hypothetical protein